MRNSGQNWWGIRCQIENLEIIPLLLFLQRGLRDLPVVFLLHLDLFFQKGQLFFQPAVLIPQQEHVCHETSTLDTDHYHEDQDACLEEKGVLHFQPEQIIISCLKKGEQGQYCHGQKEPAGHTVFKADTFPQGGSRQDAETGRDQDVKQIHAP